MTTTTEFTAIAATIKFVAEAESLVVPDFVSSTDPNGTMRSKIKGADGKPAGIKVRIDGRGPDDVAADMADGLLAFNPQLEGGVRDAQRLELLNEIKATLAIDKLKAAFPGSTEVTQSAAQPLQAA